MEYTIHTPRQLGQVLKGQRSTRHLTQAEVATRVGLLPKTVSKLERDPDTATLESLFKLLSSLQLELVVRPKPSSSASEW
ncbi:MAG: helix-turn-helix domain-containing protein [Woeseiaceae bacterium]